MKPEEFFKKEFFAIYEYFIEKSKKQSKGKGLFNRDDQGDYWWELRACAYWEEFEKDKIIYPDIVQKPQFFIDTKGEYYLINTCYMITGEKLQYILALLNSLPISWAFKKFYAGGGLGENGYRYFKEFLEKLPIPPVNQNLEDKFYKCVVEIQNQINNGKDTSFLEEKIDNMVFELYGFNQVEIDEINKKY